MSEAVAIDEYRGACENLRQTRGSGGGRTTAAMRHRLVSVMLVGLLIVWGQASAGEGTRAVPLTILFTGDTSGEYLPCGCPGSPMGGFARRATKIHDIREEGQPVLVVDTGNALLRGGLVRIDPNADSRRHAEFIGKLMQLAGTQAVAVGPRDVWALGPDRLRRLARETGVAWLSANLVSEDGKAFFPSHVVLKAGPLRVGVIGVTQPLPAVLKDTGLHFSDPVAATRAAVAVLRAKVDLLVVLCNLTFEQQEDVRSVPGIDLILAGTPETGVPAVSDDQSPCVVRVHGLGRTLGRVDLKLVLPGGGPPTRSPSLEKQYRDLAGIQGELETLKRIIVEEEGTFDWARWEREGAYLRGKRDAVMKRIRERSNSKSVFAYQEVVLFEKITPDPVVQRRIDAYDRSGAGEGVTR